MGRYSYGNRFCFISIWDNADYRNSNSWVIIGGSVYAAQKKPATDIVQKPKRRIWLLFEMLCFACSLIAAFALRWMRLSSGSTFLNSLTAYSGKQYIFLFGLPDFCDALGFPIAVPVITIILISFSLYFFLGHIILCFAKREEKQPKGILLSTSLAVSALLGEGYRMYLNTRIAQDALSGVYQVTTTGTFLLVLLFAIAAGVFGYQNKKWLAK